MWLIVDIRPYNWIELAFDLNIALDEGDTEPIEDVRAAIVAGRALEYLKENMDLFDESPHTTQDIKELNQALCDVLSEMNGDDLGVEHNGLSLLLALCLQAMRREHLGAEGAYIER